MSKSARVKAGQRHWQLVPIEVARWRLAMVWFALSALVFVILVLQTFGGVYEQRVQGAWGWALPNFVPTLALMISVFAADALKPFTTDEATVRATFYKLSMGLLIFYLVLLVGTILSVPFILGQSPDDEGSAAAALEVSNLWLAPLQGLVVAALGVLFFLKEASSGQAPTKAVPKAATDRVSVSAPPNETAGGR